MKTEITGMGGGIAMPLKGKEMVALFEKYGWERSRQRGSHVILKKYNFIEVIPVHSRELGKGIEKKLFKRIRSAIGKTWHPFISSQKSVQDMLHIINETSRISRLSHIL